MQKCSIESCSRKYRCKGYCNLHYNRWLIHGDAQAEKPARLNAAGQACSIEDCASPVRCKMLCSLHYDRMVKRGTTADPQPHVKAVCKVDGCRGFVHCLGYCEAHEQRFRTHGDPLADEPIKFIPTGAMRDDVAARILARSLETEGGCIEWQGHKSRGYGAVHWRDRSWPAHLAHWVATNGPLPGDDWTLDHLCYNRACVNLEHLEPVTRGENTMRAILRKRTGVDRIPDEVLDFLRAASAATLDGAHLFDAFKSA